MRRFAIWGILLAAIVAFPSFAYSQASIAGVVKDASGGVLPGVSVEAASPVLIEKARTVVTDGTGQYRIENLRPGTYTVTFALAGFNTVAREGVQLEGSFTATINADLRVGGVEETITVTGESPVVDVQNVTQQRVVGQEVIAELPTGKSDRALGALATSSPFRDTEYLTSFYRANISYITGAHAFKVGMNIGDSSDPTTSFPATLPYNYRFNNGVPNQITIFSTPSAVEFNSDVDMGIYGQDKWLVRQAVDCDGSAAREDPAGRWKQDVAES
jgi:hypothetical protein